MICFNFASRSRPTKFFACLENIRSLISTKDYFVLAKIDDDDRYLDQYKSGLINFPEVTAVYGRSTSKIHAINRGLESVEFDILCNHSDDMFFIKKGFDIDIIENCTPDSFIHFPDAKTTLCTYSIMDRVYYERFKYVYHPLYRNLWCDNEAMEVAKILGRYKFVDEKILEHRHPANGYGARDMQYKRTEATYYIDKRTYERRKLKHFDLKQLA